MLSLQKALISKGAEGLKADGVWGPCTQGAFETVTKQKFSKASVESFWGGAITCSSVSYAASSGICKDGSDAVTVTADTIKPPVEDGPPAPPLVQGDPLAPAQAEFVSGVPNTVLFAGAAALIIGGVFLLKKRQS